VTAPAIKIDFYNKAFELYAERVTDTHIRMAAPRWWQLGQKAQYKAEVKRIKSRLMYSMVNADPGASQEFFFCCFNYLKRNAPEGLYEGLYQVIGEGEQDDGVILGEAPEANDSD